MRQVETIMPGVHQITNIKPLSDEEWTARRLKMRADFEAWKESINGNSDTRKCKVAMD